MAELKQLLATERVLRFKVEKLIENGKKTTIAKRTQGFYETKIADLKQLWSEYSKADHTVNVLLLGDPNQADHEYLAAEYFSTLESKYTEYMSELLEGLRKYTTSTAPSTPNIPQAVIRHEDSLLPKITLPKYNGNYDTWRSFRDLFTSLVHDNSRLTPVQKLHHLKSCLIGEAEQLLRHTPITNDDYLPAWRKLKERYENKRILVNHQLKSLTTQPKQTSETANGIKLLLDTTDECLQQLKSLDVDTSTWNVLLIYLIVQKLPFYTLKLWEEEQGASQELPTYKSFNTFLKTRVKILESISDTVIPKRVQPVRETTKSHHIIKANKCPACNGAHFVQQCPKYQAMDINRRRKIIKSAGRCINCLSNKHTDNNCTSRYRCLKCNARHHTSLHEHVKSEQTVPGPTINVKSPEHSTQTNLMSERRASSNNKSSNPTGYNATNSRRLQTAQDTDEVDKTQSFIARETHEALLATALVTAQDPHGQPQVLRCLVDTGSQSSFITLAACQRLSATRTATCTSVTGLNTSPAGVSYEKTTLMLRSHGSDPISISEDFLIMKKITDRLPTKTVSKKDCQHITNLPLADPTYWKPGRIDALLGARVYSQILKEGIVKGSETAPTAINTKFGWILLGPMGEASTDEVASFISINEDSLSTQLKKFWEYEEIPETRILSKEDKECEQIYTNTCCRLPSGRYQVKLPFKDNELPELGESRQQALKRFSNLQAKFSRQPDLEQGYKQCLDEYIELGHMTEVAPPKPKEPHYYIPHHCVLKESTTTKLRVVFDASARTTNGSSLNDYLLKGPTIQPKLATILLNWRKHRFAMNADIEKMYRMIEVHPEHRTFQRIIWQHPKTLEIQEYQLNTVTFGTSAAPYLAIRTLQQLAMDERHNWPLASAVTFTDFYVDDLLTGADNIEDAAKLQHELINMLKVGGFNLRKWASNSHELLDHLPKEHRELKGTLSIAEDETVKTLGIRWHPSSDHFTYVIRFDRIYPSTTKRTILSQVASLYDPLGWLAPVIIIAKILIQTLWILGGDWDKPVSRDIEDRWEKFKNDLPNLQQLKIPRWISYADNTTVQLHGFCDASERAFAAVVYLRVEDEKGNVITNLLTAKSKVAPIKPTTIPRLD